MLHGSMSGAGMVVGLGRVLAAALVIAAAGPAAASPDDGAGPPRLELRLSPGDVETPPERARPLGYAAVVREDPWSALERRSPSVGGPAIPQTRDAAQQQSAAGKGPSLQGLLDGKTIPLLRITIDITPSF